MVGIRLKINDVKPTRDGLWSVSRTVRGDEITFTGPDRNQVLEQAQAHFNRVLSHHNAPGQGKAEASTCAYRVETS